MIRTTLIGLGALAIAATPALAAKTSATTKPVAAASAKSTHKAAKKEVAKAPQKAAHARKR
ncbi:hypothetical protein [Sphingomonas astaxanthinifaciens]|uniref:Uncharacterized protein n=1 Tax=Sphingomonas astaxanthinifaciens DSM 22298 TaxID=1123267 RepID=A0ABQ5ZAM9_9SPHN|nr:hypothetical protein [Sphingomonas astaxanthinifaciens]GLR47829.1 hypothetical protein GCM10007925_15420 [Sphingomonas astaxanthinifaciens DSM 22298]